MMVRLKRDPVHALGLVLLALAIVVTLLGAVSQPQGMNFFQLLHKIFQDFYSNVATELASIALTVLIIDRLNQHRAEERERASLILQMGSPDHAFAIEALRMLNASGWLERGALRGAQLNRANLEGAHLHHTSLVGAHLAWANLHKALLTNSDLRHVTLQSANLEGVCFRGANLAGANLNEADMSGAHIDAMTRFDDETILPDCTYWTPGTDMQRFTDPQHHDFWRPHGLREHAA
jgi:hypothetical protein